MEQKQLDTRFGTVSYTPGEDLWTTDLDIGTGFPFYFDLSKDITADIQAVNLTLSLLDRLEDIAASAKDAVDRVLMDKSHADYKDIHYFFRCHSDDMDPESFAAMLGLEAPCDPSNEEMLALLHLQRFGSHWDEGLQAQGFILDFTYHPDYNDQLLVASLNRNGLVINLSHES